MKVNWNYIKAFALLAVVVFLYSFSSRRNSARKITGVSVQFTNGENLYITDASVNKLLIVSKDSLKKKQKEILDLNDLEMRLNQNKMIENAEVYVGVNGKLGAVVTQRQPIARVMGKPDFYIDASGKPMPLSHNYSARVPLVTGLDKKEVAAVFPLLQKIGGDAFLKKHVTAISRKKNNTYAFALRGWPMEVFVGKIKNLDRKIVNFKVFYKASLKANKLGNYKKVNLQFGNQVVCTKK